MNLTKFLLALLSASAALSLANAADDEPTPEQEMWVAIMGYKDRAKMSQAYWKFLKSQYPRPVGDLEEGEEPPSDEDLYDTNPDRVAFENKCVVSGTNSIVVGPNIDAKISRESGMSDLYKELDEIVKGTKQGNADKVWNKIADKMFKLFKYEFKLYWVTTPDATRLPECSQAKVASFFSQFSGSWAANQLKIIQFDKVAMSEEQLNKCLALDHFEENLQPLCKNLKEDSSQTEVEANKACIACSINNSIVASAVGAAAFVAMALFF